MIPFRAKRTDVSRTAVHETVPDHFVLPLETFPALASWAAINRTVMRSIRAVHVLMGPVEAMWLLCKARRCQLRRTYVRRYCVWNGGAVHPL